MLTGYLLDGGNVVAELEDDALSASYLRGANLIFRTTSATEYYTFNAHGDVVGLVSAAGTQTKTYDYDAFGNEKDRLGSDPNPFRYCGEYFDVESGAYYLRARYYDPSVGRFTQEDTHWNTSNMIYGDEPQQIGEYEDPLGTSRYVYAPQITAVMQAGCLYGYGLNNPVKWRDPTGRNSVDAYEPICYGGQGVSFSLGDILVFFAGIIASIKNAMTPSKNQAPNNAATAPGSAGGDPGNDRDPKKRTGQWHHVFSKKILRELSQHKVLKGIFKRADLLIQAFTLQDHHGYETWHRDFDNAVVAWLQENKDATPIQFLQMLFDMCNTPEMLQKFGVELLEMIVELMERVG